MDQSNNLKIKLQMLWNKTAAHFPRARAKLTYHLLFQGLAQNNEFSCPRELELNRSIIEMMIPFPMMMFSSTRRVFFSIVFLFLIHVKVAHALAVAVALKKHSPGQSTAEPRGMPRMASILVAPGIASYQSPRAFFFAGAT